ncbi:MAG: amidohydrolase family protein, partial [Oscillibacter sp.]
LPQKWFDTWYEGMDLTRTSDVTVEPYDYLIGPLPQPEQRMTLGEAVKAATYNGAYANFMEKEIGSIEVGKKADLVLLNMNIFQEDIEKVSEVVPVGTIFDGKFVYQKK